MGAQYSTGMLAPEWKGWLEEHGSLETLRATYRDFRKLSASRYKPLNGHGEDGFFITAADFRQAFADVANFPPKKLGAGNDILRNKIARPGDAERGRRLHLDACFLCFDALGRGRVPSGVVWGGLALMTGSTEIGKVKFVLSMYDADRDGKVNLTELRMAMSACSTGFCRLHGIKAPPDGTLQSLAKETFFHQARMEVDRATREAEDREGDPSNENITAVSVSGTGSRGGNGGAGTIAKNLPAEAVAAFCRANTRCRNFLKGVGSSGSADLLLLYKHEHELLRELAEVDAALDENERQIKAASTGQRQYPLERGGDSRRLIVRGARVRALAQKWGDGRLLEPDAIRALLTTFADEEQTAQRMDGESANGAAGEESSVVVQNSSRNGRKVSWTDDAVRTPTIHSRHGGTGGSDEGDVRLHVEHSGSSPELQTQVLMEVGRLVRVAARRSGRGNANASNPAVIAASAASRALETQKKRRTARQAEREKGVRERARAAAASLGTGEWKSLSAMNSLAFARDYKKGMAEKAEKEPQGSEGNRSMTLTGLARGGDERASVHGGELRNVRDWELLREEQALADEARAVQGKEKNTRVSSERWSAPFATRLDVDKLEDLVEGAGGFITDRDAEAALAPAGDLEKDQLGRVTLVGYIRWSRLRERRRLEAEELCRHPPPPWQEKLACWRQTWKEHIVKEVSRAKRKLHQSPSPNDQDLADGGDSSTVLSTTESLRSRDFSGATWDGSGGGGRGGGVGDSRNTSGSSGMFGNGTARKKARKQIARLRPLPEARSSRLSAVVVIARPEQHGENVVITGRGENNATQGENIVKTTAGRDTASADPKIGGVTLPPSSVSTTASANKKIPAAAYGSATASRKSTSGYSTNGGATIRLDIVGEGERGSVAGKRSSKGMDVGVGSSVLGSGGGEGLARSDSTAREMLKWYATEETKRTEAFWQEQGQARKERETRAKSDGRSKRQIQEEEAIEGRKAAASAPKERTMRAVMWFDMPLLASAMATHAATAPDSGSGEGPSNEKKATISEKTRPAPAAVKHSANSSSSRGDLGVSSTNGSSDGGSIIAAIAAEKEAAAEAEAAEAAAADKIAQDFRGFFTCIPRDDRNELGFSDVLVSIVNIRYRNIQPKNSTAAGASGDTTTARHVAKTSAATPAKATTGSAGAGRGSRRVLRVAFFLEQDPLEIVDEPQVSLPERGPEGKAGSAYHHPLAELVVKLTLQVEFTSDLKDVLHAMTPWKNFRSRLYGPQEEELPRASLEPREHARNVLEDMQKTSAVLRRVPSMGFNELRPILAEYGLSEVGTLGELSVRVASALKGRVKGAAEGGGLSKFGEKAARMIFRAADKDKDGGLSYTEMIGMLRRMGVRAPPRAMATELDYLRALKDMGVKTDRNGFMTEDGLVAFYRDFGQLGDDIEAFGVASLNSFLGMKLSVVGEIGAAAAARLENVLLEEHPRLQRYEKALSFMTRFARDTHLDYSGASLADWLAPGEEDGWVRKWLLGPGWLARAVDGVQEWLADGDEGIIPIFRNAAKEAVARYGVTPSNGVLGILTSSGVEEQQSSERGDKFPPEGPGSDLRPLERTTFKAVDLKSPPPARCIDGRSKDSNAAPASEPPRPPPKVNGKRVVGHASRHLETTPSTTAGLSDLFSANNTTITTISEEEQFAEEAEERDATTARAGSTEERFGQTVARNSSLAKMPAGVISSKAGGRGMAAGGALSPNKERLHTARTVTITNRDSAVCRGITNSRGSERKRPFTAEGNQDLADYLGVREVHSASSGSRPTGREKGGGHVAAGLSAEDGDDGSVGSHRWHEEEDGKDVELEDIVVEAGSVGEMEAVLATAKRLQTILQSSLPSKIAEDLRKKAEVAEATAAEISQRLQVATATAIARGIRAYDAARSKMEGIATVGVGTEKVTARIQLTGFPVFSLLPAGRGEPCQGRFEEEAREARAEERRRVALDEIDRAKERQVLEEEARERKRAEAKRRKEEERMAEEIDLYERGLSARQRSADRESEKAQAEQHWRRLVALRQRRRKGTPAAAVAVNNLGVLLVEQSGRDSVQAAEGRKLLQAAVKMAECGMEKDATVRTPPDAEILVKSRSPPDKSTATATTNHSKNEILSRNKYKHNGDLNNSGNECASDITGTAGGERTSHSHAESAPANTRSPESTPATGRGSSETAERDEWAGPLALFSSNLSFAREGPGRESEYTSEVEQAQAGKETNNEQKSGSAADKVHGTASDRCEVLFKALSPSAFAIATGPTGSWLCAGVGAALFEEEDPFWWRREHPEDEEERKKTASVARGRSGAKPLSAGGTGGGSRRIAVVHSRRTRGRSGEGEEGDVGVDTGLTELEMWEVLDPVRAARIRIRMARQEAQHKRREVLIKRRKECEGKLLQEEMEAEAARAAAETARAANRLAASTARRLRKAAIMRATAAREAAEASRFVRAVRTVKALRARALGALSKRDNLMDAGSKWTSRMATKVANQLMAADTDGKTTSGNLPQGQNDPRERESKDTEDPPVSAAKTMAEAAATRAAARTAARRGVAARATSRQKPSAAVTGK